MSPPLRRRQPSVADAAWIVGPPFVAIRSRQALTRQDWASLAARTGEYHRAGMYPFCTYRYIDCEMAGRDGHACLVEPFTLHALSG